LASITEYPIPAGSPAIGNGLLGITGGPDGNVYFTDTLNNAIGQVTPSGVISELPLPTSGGGLFFNNGLAGITTGSDDRLEFGESKQGALGEITPSGSYDSVPIDPTGQNTSQGPDQITAAADGTLWFTEDGAEAIGELTTAGVFKQYQVSGAANGGIIGASMKGITIGSDGNIWFTNWGPFGDFIGKMTPSGQITEYPLASDTSPVGIVGGPDGNLWFVAYGTNTIDQMSTSGTLLNQYSVPGGSLADITVGSDGNLYFTEQTGQIGEITTSGVPTNFPVSTTVPTILGASGPQPLAITSGPDGNIWFTDPWTASIGVLKIATGPSPLPIMTALSASTASAAVGGSITLTATVSDLSAGGATPTGGMVTFSDQEGPIDTQALVNGVAMCTTSSLPAGTNTITAFYAGTADFGPSSTGRIVTAVGTAAATYADDLNQPCGLAFDSHGDLFIADAADNMVQEVVEATGNVITVAGNGMAGYEGNGQLATDAELNYPEGVVVDSTGDVFIADTLNNVVREVVQSTGDIKTVAGNGTPGYKGDGQLATDAELDNPYAVAVDSSGDLFIADWGNNVIREVVQSTGDIKTVAGTGVAGYSGDGGLAMAATLNHPEGIALDSAGDLFIADWKNNRVREVVKATSKITTVAGNGTAGEQGNGELATAAELNQPVGLAFDSMGDLFIAEYGNDVVREVFKATSNITTVAGDGKTGYSGDGGLASNAELDYPFGLAVDSAGDLFMSDVINNVVREITPSVSVNISDAGSVVQWSTAAGGNGHYYELVMPTDPSGNYSWTQANAAASEMTHDGSPGYLATVTSAAENAFLGSQFQSSLPANGCAWIGLTDDGRMGQWTWVDGEPFSYSNWAAGEPNNPGFEDWVGYTNGETPVWSWNNFQINNFGAGALYGFIVEFNPPSELSTTTALSASNTSVAVGQSVTITATVTDVSPGAATPNSGMVTFSDQNGALDSEPVVNGVATFTTLSLAAGPHSITAAYSGIADFAPSVTNTAMTVTIGAAGSVVDWSVASGGNGHHYGLVMPADPSESYSWTQANDAASGMTYDGSPGYLATVTSSAENAFLRSQFGASLSANRCEWIGLTDDGRIGEWTWVTGEPFSYSNWAAGEPNNPGIEDWANYTNDESPAWGWNNLPDTYTGSGDIYTLCGFIVEFNPPTVRSTSTALSATTVSATFGQSITFTATVSDLSVGGPAPNGGTVTFSDQAGTLDTAQLVNGVATFTTSRLHVGTNKITASYSGTASFAPSATDKDVTVTISKAHTVTAAVSTSTTFSTARKTIQLRATVTSGARKVNTGTVSFTILKGKRTIGSTVTGKVANSAAHVNYVLPAGTAAGTYTIRAVYSGTAEFASSSDTHHTLTIKAGGQPPKTIGDAVLTVPQTKRERRLAASPAWKAFRFSFYSALSWATAGRAQFMARRDP
jgi:streptogramin lyase